MRVSCLIATLATRGDTPVAVDGRSVPAGGVAHRSFMLHEPAVRAWPSWRLARLGAARVFHLGLLAIAIVLIPAAVHAQAMTGTVQGTSGAVLPGVNVEAASPELIEKVRTAVTDSSGQTARFAKANVQFAFWNGFRNVSHSEPPRTPRPQSNRFRALLCVLGDLCAQKIGSAVRQPATSKCRQPAFERG